MKFTIYVMNKLSKKKIILIISALLTILLIVLSAALTIYYHKNNFKFKVQKLCEKLRVVDFNDDHNQIIDVMEYARKKHTISRHILINIDTHSDVYVYCPKYGKIIKRNNKASIADWVNYYILQNPDVTEIFWVTPDEMLSNSFVIERFIDQGEDLFIALFGNCSKPPISVTANIWSEPLVQYFYINKNDSNDFIEPANDKDEEKYKKNKNYRKIKFTTCTLATLPKFSKGHNFVLSIDFDYLSNSGFDTIAGFNTDKNEKEIKALFNDILKTLIKNNVRPKVISLTLSPVYVPDDDIYVMKNIANDFIKHSGKKDALKHYKHRWHEREVTKFDPKKQINLKSRSNNKTNSRKK